MQVEEFFRNLIWLVILAPSEIFYKTQEKMVPKPEKIADNHPFKYQHLNTVFRLSNNLSEFKTRTHKFKRLIQLKTMFSKLV